jgi:hypothetical protein
METDDYFLVTLIDALVTVPLHFTVMSNLISQSEKQYLDELEIYFKIFFCFIGSLNSHNEEKRSFNKNIHHEIFTPHLLFGIQYSFSHLQVSYQSLKNVSNPHIYPKARAIAREKDGQNISRTAPKRN